MRTLNLIVFALVLFAMFCAIAPFAHGQGVGLVVTASHTYFPPTPSYYPGSFYSGGVDYGYNTLPILPYGYSGYYGGLLGLAFSHPESEEAQSKREDGKNLQRAGKASKDVVKAYKDCVGFNAKLKLPNPSERCQPILEMARKPIS
jgi:hypothetical protein